MAKKKKAKSVTLRFGGRDYILGEGYKFNLRFNVLLDPEGDMIGTLTIKNQEIEVISID
jgi:hypothetical protein